MMAASGELIGRDAELALVGAFVAGCDRLSAALLVRGVPGIGKTSVWREGVRLARERAYRTLVANPSERPVAQRPVAIEVLNGKSASFPLKGTAGAVLFVQYLQAGKRPEIVWFTIAVAGLPRGIDYLADAGDCVGGHPSTLALVSAVPDPQTDLLILPIGNVPGSASTVIWIEVTSALGNQLGSVRGGFLAPGSTVPIAAGGSLCPQQALAPLPAAAALNAAWNAA
jgi:hypothetical protein